MGKKISNQPVSGSERLLKSTVSAGSMTVVSRVTGLARDVIFAQLVGSTFVADAFFVAFRIPNFFRRIFGEGAFSAAFVPVYTQHRISQPPTEVKSFVNSVTGKLVLALLLIVAVGVVAAPAMVSILAPGFHGEPAKFQLTVDALRLTFPYLFFICLVALSAAILNTLGHFAAPAATPILLNLALIASALWLTGLVGNAAIALSLGVLGAGVLQLAFQIPFLKRVDAIPVPQLKQSRNEQTREAVKEVRRLMIPAVFGTSVAQLNLIINTFIASFLATGSVSWLYYSDRLMEFPLGVFGVALGTVILPRLSKVHAESSPAEFSAVLDWGMRWCFIIALPSTAGLIALAKPIMATLFFHGAFTELDVDMSARALVAFSTGLTGLVAVRVLSPGFFARNNTKTPVNAGIAAMIANAILAIVLVLYLEHVGLALATSLAAYLNAGILLVLLIKDRCFNPLPGWPMFLCRVFGASSIMAVALLWSISDSSAWLEFGLAERVLHLVPRILGGAAVYVACLFALGIRVGHLIRK